VKGENGLYKIRLISLTLNLVDGDNFIVLGPKPSAVLRDPPSSSVCFLRVPFPCRGRRLAAFWLEVGAPSDFCVRHCHLVEWRDWQPARSRTPRWVKTWERNSSFLTFLNCVRRFVFTLAKNNRSSFQYILLLYSIR
jgi:hypothetical protein